MQIFKNMVQTWLLFGILTLAGGQIIYPDQYDIMMADVGRASASLPADYSVLQAASSQPIQIDQQFNGKPASQFGARPEGQMNLTITRIPLYSTNLTASSQPMPETWSNHVNHYSITCIYSRNHDDY